MKVLHLLQKVGSLNVFCSKTCFPSDVENLFAWSWSEVLFMCGETLFSIFGSDFCVISVGFWRFDTLGFGVEFEVEVEVEFEFEFEFKLKFGLEAEIGLFLKSTLKEDGGFWVTIFDGCCCCCWVFVWEFMGTGAGFLGGRGAGLLGAIGAIFFGGRGTFFGGRIGFSFFFFFFFKFYDFKIIIECVP